MTAASLGNVVAQGAGASPAGAGRGIAIFVAFGVCLVVAAAFCLHAFWMVQNHDNDWYLVVARRVLAGGRYGRDFMEPNPPLIILLMLPPVVLAELLGRDPDTVFTAYVCGLILLSVLLARRPLLWTMADHPRGGQLLLLLYAVILSLQPGYDFGQREHLFVILFCPGLFWFAARDAGDTRPVTAVDAVAILFAAIAVLIKPFLLLVPLMLLALKAARHRTWRVVLDGSVAVFVAVAILYVGLILLAFPDYLPEAAVQRQVYFAWDRAWFTVFGKSREAFAALSLAIVLTELMPLAERTRTLLRHLCVAAATCLFLALWQKKAWAYHLLPTIEMAGVVLACGIIAMVQYVEGRRWPPISAVVICAAILVEGGALVLRPFEETFTFARSRFLASPLIATLRHSFRGKSLLLLTSGYQPGIPSLAAVRLGARAPSQLLLPGTVRLASGNAADRQKSIDLRRRATDLLIHDLERYRPDVVAVDRRPVKQSLPDDFDVLGFYEADPQFRQAWLAYRLTTSINGWDLYTRDAPKGAAGN